MKRIFIIPSILCVLLLAACSDEVPEAASQEKTPLTVGSVSVTTTTRATVDKFFEDGDEIWLGAYSLKPGIPDYGTNFAYDKPTGTWEPAEGAASIYLEDVYSDGTATHELRIVFGVIQSDQSSTEAFHLSDAVSGAATLVIKDGCPTPVVHAEKLEREGLLVELTIVKGKYWDDDTEFLAFLAAHDARFVDTDGNGVYTPYQPADGEYHVIIFPFELPASGAPLFQLWEKGPGAAVATCRWTAPQPDYQPTAGTILAIEAFLDKENGDMGVPTISIKPWGHDKDKDKELPGERQ